MTKKYEFTGEIKDWYGVKLKRIKALKDFGDVKEGDLGGWIEQENNLSHKGKCWVYDNAIARENACIRENAAIYNDVEVFGKALLHNDAKALHTSRIYDSAELYGQAVIYDTAQIFQNARVGVKAKIAGAARICGNAWVCGSSRVNGFAVVKDSTEIFGNAVISESACIHGNSRIFGNAEISDYAEIRGNTIIAEDIKICRNALIESTRDYLFIGPIGSKNRTVTVFKTTDGLKIIAGCFYGTIDEFEDRVKVFHKDNEYGEEYIIFIELLKKRFNKKFPSNGGNHYEGIKEK